MKSRNKGILGTSCRELRIHLRNAHPTAWNVTARMNRHQPFAGHRNAVKAPPTCKGWVKSAGAFVCHFDHQVSSRSTAGRVAGVFSRRARYNTWAIAPMLGARGALLSGFPSISSNTDAGVHLCKQVSGSGASLRKITFSFSCRRRYC